MQIFAFCLNEDHHFFPLKSILLMAQHHLDKMEKKIIKQNKKARKPLISFLDFAMLIT